MLGKKLEISEILLFLRIITVLQELLKTLGLFLLPHVYVCAHRHGGHLISCQWTTFTATLLSLPACLPLSSTLFLSYHSPSSALQFFPILFSSHLLPHSVTVTWVLVHLYHFREHNIAVASNWPYLSNYPYLTSLKPDPNVIILCDHQAFSSPGQSTMKKYVVILDL